MKKLFPKGYCLICLGTGYGNIFSFDMGLFGDIFVSGKSLKCNTFRNGLFDI